MLKALLFALAAAQPVEILPLPPTPDELQHELDVAQKEKRDREDVAFQLAFYPPFEVVDAACDTATVRLKAIGLQLSCLTDNYPGYAAIEAEAAGLRDMREALSELRDCKENETTRLRGYWTVDTDILQKLSDYRAACVRHGKDPHGLLLPPTWPVPE